MVASLVTFFSLFKTFFISFIHRFGERIRSWFFVVVVRWQQCMYNFRLHSSNRTIICTFFHLNWISTDLYGAIDLPDQNAVWWTITDGVWLKCEEQRKKRESVHFWKVKRYISCTEKDAINFYRFENWEAFDECGFHRKIRKKKTKYHSTL